MRLYLSSFRNGNKPEKLLELLGEGRHTAVIFNAVDFRTEADRATDYAAEAQRLKSIGLEPTEVDLRNYFGKPSADLKETLAGFDLIWVRGGNPFILRRAFKQSGADTVIPELLAEDAVVYGGYSAVCILSPHLHGIELVDPPDVVPDGYDPEIIWDGLGILPYGIAPHYKSDHPESAGIDQAVAYYIENHIPFIALRDGEAIVVNGDHEEIVS